MAYLDKLNGVLQKYNTSVTILEITGKFANLSNGVTITDVAELRKLKRRIAYESHEYLLRFDLIYSTDVGASSLALSEAKSATSRIGGKRVQELHGEKIAKENLNKGEPWNKGLKGKYPYSSWAKGLTKETSESVKRISESKTGAKNPMYGKRHSDEYKKAHSMRMKEKILNGEFTPNTNNRNTHWDSFYNGTKYRSSWEALYQSIDESAEYESLRIPYVINGKDKVYIVDFVNRKSKVVTEVKPTEHQSGKVFLAKMAALELWANENGYTINMFDQAAISKIAGPDYNKFDTNTSRKIKNIYETCKKNRN